MDQAKRIKQIAHYCKQARWSAELTDTITHYLSGANTLAQVDQAWQSFNDRKPLGVWGMRVLSAPEDGPLDALDLRLLDLFEHFGEIWHFLYETADRDVGPQIADHLRSRGRDEQTIRRYFFSVTGNVSYDGTKSPETLTWIGRYLLTYLPAYAEEMFNAQKFNYRRFFRLLLLVQPPVPELVWQFAQRLEQREISPYDLEGCVTLFLEADPARFTPWARRLASQSSPLTGEASKLAVLRVLMEHDPAQHIDLALEAAQTPSVERRAWLPCVALREAYAFDPARSWPLVKAAAVSRNYWVSSDAIQLLGKAPFQQALPVLQCCVIEGHARAGFQALERLLKQPWAGQQVFLRMLLAHRSKRIRERAAAVLKSQGVAIP